MRPPTSKKGPLRALGAQLLGAALIALDAQQLASQDADARPRTRFYRLFEAISNERIAEVRRRLPTAAHINDLDTTSGCTPLTWTLTPGDAPTPAQLQILVLLLDRGADPNVRDGNGVSAMEAAVAYPWPEALRRFIARGGDVRTPAAVGETTLLYSVCTSSSSPWPGIETQRLEIAQLLLDAGLDPTATTPWAEAHDFSAVDQCIVYHLPEIARLYARRGARPRSMVGSTDPERAGLVRELLGLAGSR
jgi:hypothetical protein